MSCACALKGTGLGFPTTRRAVFSLVRTPSRSNSVSNGKYRSRDTRLRTFSEVPRTKSHVATPRGDSQMQEPGVKYLTANAVPANADKTGLTGQEIARLYSVRLPELVG